MRWDIYKKRKQQKLLTNPVAFNKLQTEVLAYLIIRPESSIKMIFEFGFNRCDFEPKFSSSINSLFANL